MFDSLCEHLDMNINRLKKINNEERILACLHGMLYSCHKEHTSQCHDELMTLANDGMATPIKEYLQRYEQCIMFQCPHVCVLKPCLPSTTCAHDVVFVGICRMMCGRSGWVCIEPPISQLDNLNPLLNDTTQCSRAFMYPWKT